jgi:hypothetical protein
MMTTNQIKSVKVFDLDTKKHQFNIEVYNSNENHIRGYVAKKLDGTQIGNTRFFMLHKTITEVSAEFKKYIRQNNVII